VWKKAELVSLKDLAIGDVLLANFTGRTPTSDGVCSDLWVGVDEQTRATESLRAAQKRLSAAVR